MIVRWSRWVRVLTVVVLAGAVIVGVPSIRRELLRSAGWTLVVSDPVEPADIIVLAVDFSGAEVLEAADLVHAGMDVRVAMFAAGPPDSVEREFSRRGIPYEDLALFRPVRLLRALGVTAIEQIPRARWNRVRSGGSARLVRSASIPVNRGSEQPRPFAASPS